MAFSLLAKRNHPEPFFYQAIIWQVNFKEKIYPYILAAIQLSSLVFILVSAPGIAMDYGGMLVECAGLFLGLLAVFQMGIGNFNITPRLKNGGVFVSSGIYSIIRPPMYLAQLVFLIPLVIDYFTYLRLAVWLLLLFVLFLKMNFEEKSLASHFEGYSEYMEKTRRLVPFIY